jgi:hypothetical protein
VAADVQFADLTGSNKDHHKEHQARQEHQEKQGNAQI